MRRAFTLLILAIVGASGCDDQRDTPTSPPDLAVSQAKDLQEVSAEKVAPASELVMTPAGYYHRSCVHEAPAASVVRKGGVATLSDGSEVEFEKCEFPGRRTKGGTRVSAPTTGWDWIEYTRKVFHDEHTFGYLETEWIVPDDPLGSYTGQRVYYAFPGLSSIEYIIQPVLSYGYNGVYGGSHWKLSSWHCDDGDNCTNSTPISASAGDTIRGTVFSQDCDEDECLWVVSTENLTTEFFTFLYIWDTWDYPIAYGGVVEVYDISECSQYPRDGVSFYDTVLENENGSPVLPSWSEIVAPNLDPACDFDVEATSASADLYHNPPQLTVDIDGPTYVSQRGTYEWEADVSGGIGNYTYQWYYRTNHTEGCTYITDYVSGGTSDSMEAYIQVPGYRQQIWLRVTSGDQIVGDTKYVELSRSMECPEKGG